ncbi:InlB B-repeat-containing protein [Clostridium sp.]|uniref:InlB B-repeat-containing protein n=1 Tax=Clostridium sp. TaxID=1506 RepID=UPI00262ADCF6|nr:InlB B-repeat-containing protein [uncultured Clostridium sp.]
MKKVLIITVSLIFLFLNIPVTASAIENTTLSSISKETVSNAEGKKADTIKPVVENKDTEAEKVNKLDNVYFNSNGGLNLPVQSVAYNGKVIVPQNPTKEGYAFGGWYKDNNTFVNLFDFTNTLITEDTTLFAKWTINKYIVSFYSQGGSSESNISGDYNGVIKQPKSPIKTGYTFGGWYKESNCTNVWNFTTCKVTYNTSLYAKWILILPPTTPANVKTTVISSTSIKLTWNAAKGTNGYQVYRATSSKGVYILLTKTPYLYYTNSGLVTGKVYYYKIRSYRSIGKTILYSKWTALTSRMTSSIVFNSLVQPNPVYGEYAGLKVEIKDETNSRYLIRKSNGSQLWVACSRVAIAKNPATNTKYLTKKQIETYVNITSTFVSKTKYFTWVDLNRQRVNVFTGSAKHWRLVKSYSCATGNNITPSKRGLFTIKDKGASFVAGRGTIVKYWTRYSGNYMLHSIILTTRGAVCDSTIGKRVSHGCIRIPLDMAKWYYNTISKGSLIWVN